MKKVKPEVDYYVRVGVNGIAWNSEMPWYKSELKLASEVNLMINGVKTKWRPVYKKD